MGEPDDADEDDEEEDDDDDDDDDDDEDTNIDVLVSNISNVRRHAANRPTIADEIPSTPTSTLSCTPICTPTSPLPRDPSCTLSCALTATPPSTPTCIPISSLSSSVKMEADTCSTYRLTA